MGKWENEKMRKWENEKMRKVCITGPLYKNYVILVVISDPCGPVMYTFLIFAFFRENEKNEKIRRKMRN